MAVRRIAAWGTAALAGLAALAGPVAAREEPPPAPAPAPAESDEVRALRTEMEETFQRVERDFLALTGPKARETIAALAKAVADTAGGPAPEAWIGAGLLGPEVAPRLHARQSEVAAKADPAAAPRSYAETLADAVRLVFPEATAADNWDRHFLDLDVVRRWARLLAAAKGAGADPDGARPDAPDAPTVPPPVPDAVPDPAEMVLVPKGDLAVPENRGRGWPNLDQKADRRQVRAFYLDRTEVSCGAYAEFLRELKDAKLRERILPSGWRIDEKGAPVLPDGTGTLPVTGLPYEGAAAFAAAHGKRLPTEDEWERAARGNDGWRFPWGNEWVDGNAVVGGGAGPLPVGTTDGDASPFGVRDLCGNVSELCATLPDGKPIKGNPRADAQVVRRGGNFHDPPEEAANDWRYVIGATARSETVGFRCAMDEKDYEKRFGKK